MTGELKYKELELPNYHNSRAIFAGLTVSDLAKAAVLGGLNLLLVGDTGSGKTQLASDIYQHYFRGNKEEGGQGVFMRAHPDIDIYNEIFTKLNIEKKQRELTNSLEAMIFWVDEINRAPPIGQNQFFGLGDGKMDYGGREINIGRNGYRFLIATANIGNGEFSGTFDTDKALFSRLHVTLNLEHAPMKPTYEDKEKIRKRKADPNVVTAHKRDISDKIAKAREEIRNATINEDLETRAILDYLEQGLQNCQSYGVKDMVWPMGCQDCTHNKTGDALCSLIKEPTTRTMEVVRLYAESLKYLAKLKNPEIEIDPAELVFKTFELTGAYQHLLNPSKLREHYGHNPKLMVETVKKLKDDYTNVRPYILTSLEMTKEGKKVTSFFKTKKNECGDELFGPYEDYKSISEEAKKREEVLKVEPYGDKREVGLSWVPKLLNNIIEETQEKQGE